MDMIEKARDAAGRYLGDRGYEHEARIIKDGHGDDFAEVRIALHLLAQQAEQVDRYERALANYADPDFEETDPGLLARFALEGRNLPIQVGD